MKSLQNEDPDYKPHVSIEATEATRLMKVRPELDRSVGKRNGIAHRGREWYRVSKVLEGRCPRACSSILAHMTGGSLETGRFILMASLMFVKAHMREHGKIYEF